THCMEHGRGVEGQAVYYGTGSRHGKTENRITLSGCAPTCAAVRWLLHMMSFIGEAIAVRIDLQQAPRESEIFRTFK
ncbi:MAG TPA: hypothetical protein VEI25_04375, partial [Paraburkholderia sp.]|nr:hypothetical protein [Paraburkholderia sp.]